MDDIIGSFRPDLFEGRVVLVSGATSGIGLAIAQGFRRLGADVLATGTSAQKLDAVRADPDCAGIRFDSLDVRRTDQVQRVIGAEPRLDVLVNAHGIARADEEFDEAIFADTLDINLTSAMRLSTAARPKLAATKGAIINITSMLSYLADPAVPAYVASKTGLVGLTRALAHAYGPEGIRVNAISPGYHKTDMTAPLWRVPQSEEAIRRHTALGRWGITEDLVGAAVFLASPAASYITGADLPVDGGYVVGAVTS